MSVSTEDTVTIECVAGHTFQIPRPKKGKWPKYCPEHRRFFFEQLSRRLKPPRRVTLEWNEQGEMMGDSDYTRRWTKVWMNTVRMVGAHGGTWSAVDVELVEHYVRALRMCELHRLYAQDNPYTETSRGTVRPHPGFALSREEEKRAKEFAVELGLVTNGDEPAKSNGHKPRNPGDYYNTKLQNEAEDVGELSSPTGPDGAGL